MEKSQNTNFTSPNQQSRYQYQRSEITNCDIIENKILHCQQQNNNQSLTKNRDEEKVKNLKDAIPDIDNIFDIRKRIGSGTFSTVFLANLKRCNDETDEDAKKTNVDKRKLFAIKHVIPTSSPQRIVKELKCLVDIGGVDNVIGIRLCLRRNENVAFVMPYIEHDKFQTYFEKMSLSEVQLYMKNLLIALKRVHKFNIIHRDVKPSNFLYNRKTKEFLLIDFGLAQSVLSRADREASLLKRKYNDDRNSINESTTLNNSNSSNSNKKICRDNKGNDSQQKSPEKMPLKPLNGVTTSASINLNGTTGNSGNATCSTEQTNKNSKSESPNSLKSNIQFDKITSNILNQKSYKRNTLHLKSTVLNEHPKQSNSTYMNTISPNTHQYQSNKCSCFGKTQVCKECLLRKEIPASRAGTPGYRPPEVLLKYTDQTTAVDVWAAGVVFMSILSGVYPFFKAPDDFIALAEIVMLFGDEVIRKTAFSLGRQVTMSRKCKPLNLRRLCVRLRNRHKIDRSGLLAKFEESGKKCEECTNCQQMFYDCLCDRTKYKVEGVGEDTFPDSAYDFLAKLLEINPHKRITAAKALHHPFLREKFD